VSTSSFVLADTIDAPPEWSFVDMDAITERELSDYLKFAAEAHKETHKPAIDSLCIEEQSDSRFILVMKLTYKPNKCVLNTARKAMRSWPNLNSLVAYIKTLPVDDVPITLQLRKSDEPMDHPPDDGEATA
jgi:hypothetical protein